MTSRSKDQKPDAVSLTKRRPQAFAKFNPRADHRAALKKVLEQDPRPSYQNSEERVYGLSFAGMEIKFQVKDEVLHVVGVEM